MSGLTGAAESTFRVLVTVASGFIRGATRRTTDASWAVLLHLLGKDDDWWVLLASQTIVVHTVARAYVLHAHPEPVGRA